MRRQPLNLNKPEHARRYLKGLEADGVLEFDGMECAENLDDEDVLEIAKFWFLTIHGGEFVTQ